MKKSEFQNFEFFARRLQRKIAIFLVFNVAPAFNPGYRNSNKITSLKSITSEITPHNYRPIKLTLPTK